MTQINSKVERRIATREDVEAVEVGGLAVNAWGRLSRVTRIHGYGRTADGRAYVMYYTAAGDDDTFEVSTNLVEGDELRHWD